MNEPLTEPVAVDHTETETVTADTVDHDQDELVVEDLLVEEVSIDGMCGVY